MKTTPTNRVEISFAALDASREDAVILFAGKDMALSNLGRSLDEASEGALVASATAADFKGKSKSFIDVLAPRGLKEARVLLCGVGASKDAKENDWVNLGGAIMGQLLSRKVTSASVVAEAPLDSPEMTAELATAVALGAQLR
ncbi:MAG: M17 family peptidase N-terminal domain-containing protein, partial [Pseudomonadota bacterium]